MITDPYFQVFKQAGDHNKWQKHIDYVSFMDDINPVEKELFATAINFLEKELGKWFLKTSGYSHPLYQLIANKAHWQRQEFIQFTATLQALKATAGNYPKLKSILLKRERAIIEGMPFIEIAEKYLKQGFKINFPIESKLTKSPDIELINSTNNDILFIEVSTVDQSQDRKQINNNYYFIHRLFNFDPPVFLFTGKQKKEIAKVEYPEIQAIIYASKRKVQEQNKIVFHKDNRFEFTLAPFTLIEEFDKICTVKETRKNDFCGLPLDFDETERIISKLNRKKARQIPLTNNGIIYFPVSPLFFMLTDLQSSVNRLHSYISKFPNLLGIVLGSKSLREESDKISRSNKHIYSRIVKYKSLCLENLFVRNSSCNQSISNETLTKIFNSLK
jgi:hypothetical protein